MIKNITNEIPKEKTIPVFKVCTALLICLAPIFCALIAETEALTATVGRIAKLFNLLTAPTAAEADTPKVLAKAVRNRNDTLTIAF